MAKRRKKSRKASKKRRKSTKKRKARRSTKIPLKLLEKRAGKLVRLVRSRGGRVSC